MKEERRRTIGEVAVSPRRFRKAARSADLVPAWGIGAVARAYLKVIDTANKMEISELKAPPAGGATSR